ncbi:hypothetical protein [Rhodobacter calidifons]|uniref:Uncharacterized protein n=1 Tax=Rhodobacter calidifons TaxID=2715277 RepID=A0ABX0G7G5_9RHOB|nr:hypothetical protein [Rhodobacter calidifons]NHB77243.1 hypothetical protein [Rhodobacter calidifons]
MSRKLRCLVIGIPEAKPAEGSLRPEEFASISLDELDSYLPLPAALELVVAPLFCNRFDALEIIERLGAQDYRKVLRVVAPRLPNRQVVLRELRSHAARQGMTIELIEEG